MLALGAACTFVALSVGAATASTEAPAAVTYVHAERIFLNRGTLDGVQVGTEAEVIQEGETIARLKVERSSEHHSTAIVIFQSRSPRAGDPARLLVQAEPAPALPEPKPTYSTVDWPVVAPPAFTKVPYQSKTPENLNPLTRGRASAHLRTGFWLHGDSDPSHLLQRTLIDLFVRGPVDRDERWWIEADLRAGLQTLAPEDLRNSPGSAAWAEVHRANLEYRSSTGWGLGLGRGSSSRLRYGLFDGVFATWRWPEGPRLRLSAGTRPSELDLSPGLAVPVLSLTLQGLADLGPAVLTYDLSSQWIGATEDVGPALEAGVRLSYNAMRRYNLVLEAGGLASGDSAWLDRALLSGNLWLGEASRVRLSARIYDGGGLAAQAQQLPSEYLSGGLTYDVSGSLQRVGWQLGQSRLDTELLAGSTGGLDGSQQRYWLSPNATIHLRKWRRTLIRLNYRAEGGWVVAHLLSVGASFTLTDALRFDFTQQVGALTLRDSGQFLPTLGTWAQLGYRLNKHLHIDARLRARYGDAGAGAEGWIGLSGAVGW